MADDNIIRVGISADASALKSGMAEAVATSKASLDQLKSDYAEATASVKASTASLADAQKQLGAAAAAGNQQAIGVIQQYEAELGAATAAQAESKAALDQLNAALLENVAASNAAAGGQRALGGAFGQTYLQARVLAGAMGVNGAVGYAMARMASQSTVLAPLMGAVFPVTLGLAMGEVLAQIVNKVIDWVAGVKDLEEYNETIGKQLEQQEHLVAQLTKQTQEAQLKILGIVSGAGAESTAKATILGVAIEKDKKEIAGLEKYLKDTQARIAKDSATTTQPLGVDDYGRPFGQGATGPANPTDLKDAQNQLATITGQLRVARAQFTADATKAAADQAEAGKQLAAEEAKTLREREAAMRKAEADMAKVDADRLTDIKLAAAAEGQTQEQTLAQERTFIESRIAAESGYPDRVRRLRQELATVEEEYLRKAEENYAKGQRLAEESARKLAEQTKKANAAEAKLFEEQLRAKIKASGEIEKLDEARLEAGTEANVGNLQTQKVALQAQTKLQGPDPGLNPFSSKSRDIEQLKAMQAIDEQIIQQEIDLQRRLAEIRSAGGDTTRAQEALRKQYQIESQLDQKRITDHAQVMLTMRQQYQQYFDIVNQGMINGLNGWISGNETIEQATRQMLVQLLEHFADYFAQKALLSAESWLLEKILGQTTQSTMGASEVTSNAAVAAAATFASTAAIPVVGPALAPAAAASAFATVVGTYLPLATFETGGIVPATGLAMVHQGEGVLTAPATNLLLNLAKQNAAAPNPGNNVTIHANQTYNGMGDSQFQQMLTKNASHVLRTVKTGLRKANLA